MYTGLTQLETELKRLLPARRLNQAPGKALAETARVWSAEVWRCAQLAGPMLFTADIAEKGRNLAQRPLFICGVHRSGTTLIRDLLDDHPALSVLPSEGTFLTNLGPQLKRLPPDSRAEYLATEWLRRLMNPINQPPYWLLGESSMDTSPYVDFARAFITWHVAAKQSFKTSLWPHLAVALAYATVNSGLDAAYWVDKTPTQERYLPQLWQDFPQAKVIHILRDPRDTFRSRRQMEPGLDVRRCLKDLRLSYQVAFDEAAKRPDTYLVLHYEELCEAPAEVMQRVADFLQIDMLPQLLSATVAGKPTQANSSFNADLPAGDVVKVASHRAAEALSDQEEALLSAWLFDVAGKAGYELKPMNGWKRWWMRTTG